MQKKGSFCDLTVRCGDRSFPVHKIVVSAHSDWFLQACTSSSKVSRQRDKPASGSDSDQDTSISTIDLRDDDEHEVAAMLKYCYLFKIEDENVPNVGPITFDVRMFALGEKYNIPGLCALAVETIDDNAKRHNFSEQDFCRAVHEAYINNTVSVTKSPHRQLLRSTLLRFATEEANLFLSGSMKPFDDLLNSLPAFAADTTRALAAQGSTRETRAYRCPDGDSERWFWMDVPGSGEYRHDCEICEKWHTMTGIEWRALRVWDVWE